MKQLKMLLVKMGMWTVDTRAQRAVVVVLLLAAVVTAVAAVFAVFGSFANAAAEIGAWAGPTWGLLAAEAMILAGYLCWLLGLRRGEAPQPSTVLTWARVLGTVVGTAPLLGLAGTLIGAGDAYRALGSVTQAADLMDSLGVVLGGLQNAFNASLLGVGIAITGSVCRALHATALHRVTAAAPAAIAAGADPNVVVALTTLVALQRRQLEVMEANAERSYTVEQTHGA